MKKLTKTSLLVSVLALVVALGACALTGCSGSGSGSNNTSGTRSFTDSLGRTVEVPAKITKVAPSGAVANQVLLTFAPELMSSLADSLSDTELKYIDAKYSKLPVTGSALNNKGNLNKEEVAATGAQILIDWGEAKSGLAEDIEKLQEQLGIPVVHIDATLSTYGEAYKMLGELLGLEDRGKTMGEYCQKVYDEVAAVMDTIPVDERVTCAYLVGDAGLNAIAKGSYQGSIIDMCAQNVVVVEKVVGSGFGNEISLEQLSVWDPELIVFGPGSIYDTVSSNATWAGLKAIANKNYYEVPSQPFTWLNNPPTVNQIMGLQWFARLCYTDKFTTSIADVTKSYYKLFYNCDLSDAQVKELTAKAVRA